MIPVNLPRAQELMASASLDAIVAASPTNVGYLTGHFLSLEPLFKEYMLDPGATGTAAFPSFGVLPVAGDQGLVVNAPFAANPSSIGAENIFPYGHLPTATTAGTCEGATVGGLLQTVLAAGSRTAIDALVDLLESRGLADGRLGIEREAVTPDLEALLGEALPRASVRDCTSLFRVLRAVKTPEEIELLARAAEASTQAALDAVDRAVPEVALGELIEQYRRSLAAAGADVAHFLVGRAGVGLTSDPAYTLGRDEITLVDFGCVLGHYYSDAAWTIAIGELPRWVEQWVGGLEEAIAAGAEALRPGALSSEVSAAMARVLAGRDLRGHTLPHGHGLGLEVRDYPILVPANGRRIRDECIDRSADMPLEPGMVLSLEVSVHLPGVASAVTERSFVIETTSGRALVPNWPEQPVRVGPRR